MSKEIEDGSTATNPFIDKIEICNSLIKQCTKKSEVEETKQSDTVQSTQMTNLENAVKSGKVLAAPSKQEKDQ